ELPPCSPLPEQVPALVERLLCGAQPLALLGTAELAVGEFLAQFVLGVDQVADRGHDLLVVHAPTVKPPAWCCRLRGGETSPRPRPLASPPRTRAGGRLRRRSRPWWPGLAG